MDQAVFTINEAAQLLNCARSSIYRMQKGGEIEIVKTPIGPRIPATELERLSSGKPLRIVREPDPRRQAMAAHARAGKVANTNVIGLVETVLRRLDAIEARLIANGMIAEGEPEPRQPPADDVAVQSGAPIGSRW